MVAARTSDSNRNGEWTRLWKPGILPFSKRKGERLATIGRHLGRLDAQTFAHLPWGWSILYHLAGLDRDRFEQFIKAGVIHPGLTLQEATQLKYPGRRATSQTRIDVNQRLQ